MAVATFPEATTCNADVGTPRTVCHVSLTLKTGGLERILCDLARHHHRSEYTPIFVAMRDVGRFADEIRATGCPVYRLQSTGRLGQITELAEILRRERVDLVHTHNTYPHLYGTLAARWAGVPVVVQTRHGQRAGHGWKSRVLYRAATMLADRVVAVSDDAAQLCLKADGLPSRKVQRIWNGIDLADFQFRGPVARPTAISVARLSPEKDFPTLLRATALTVQSVPDFVLKVVGDGPQRPELQRLAEELQLGSHVEWLGERTDVPELLATAGFFVTASLTEGISLTLLEAMAVGLPVVATRAGGNGEIVEDGRTGLLTPIGDAERLSDAMIEMCGRQSEWTTLGQRGHDRVMQYFNVDQMVTAYEALYTELLAKHPAKRRRN